MKKTLIMVLALSLLSLQVTMAGTSDANWSLLRSIASGQIIVAKTFSGKSLKGPFLRATDSALELNVNGERIELKSAEVSRVYVQRGRPILKWTLIGTAVGTASGAGLGAYEGRNDHWFGPGFDTAIGAGIGLIAGSITGLAIGASHHKNELVYKAVK
jgi:hypothetical protein